MTVPMVGEQTVLQFLLNSTNRHLTVRLAKNPLAADLDAVVLTDLVESTFDGYAAIVDPPFDPISTNPEGFAEGLSFPLIWTAGPAIVSESITAMYVTLRDGTDPEKLMSVHRVGIGYQMHTPGQTFARKIRLMVADRAA